MKKGLPSPCTPIPPKTFIWVRGLPERCDLRAPVLIRSFVGVSFPSSPAFPLCPATGSALTVLKRPFTQRLSAPSSCVKALLPMMGQRDLRMLLSLHGSRVSACADAARPHTADGVVTRGYVHALCHHRLSRRHRDFFPKLPPALPAGRCKPLCPACPLKVLQFNRYIPICYWLENFSRQK